MSVLKFQKECYDESIMYNEDFNVKLKNFGRLKSVRTYLSRSPLVINIFILLFQADTFVYELQ